VVLQLRRVDDHHVIVAGDIRQAAVQFARRQGQDPERESPLSPWPRIHGRQIRPLQCATGRVRVHEEHAVAGVREDVC